MELGLRLGEASSKPSDSTNKIIELFKGRSSNSCPSDGGEDTEEEGDDDHRHNRLEMISLNSAMAQDEEDNDLKPSGSMDPPVQLDLLPHTPVVPHKGGSSGAGSSSGSSLNSGGSSFQMDLGINNRHEKKTSSSRASDNEGDQSGSSRTKKLRLSKEQSAFLEESFKEHHTLNPKQKLALAKQLNLRPRQVEVWFQNRRARTKLKQTEVDCEYLKKCCETLTEENRRLHKELQELRALKSTSSPFYMQLPATTLTMCPSCERVSSASAAASSVAATSKAIEPPPFSKAATGLFFLDKPTQ
ncbi:homeobox-leucine zipper protein HOX11-like [Punica granatum]|uniref:Homeobox domain-containing protein n=2 Tax=Punica granatum TaxID=22663 RepID=A0A218WXH6_PUNGR|nr:homeobox-leucine zipper protein HOX11-like [Punica granatum]OWM77219.1 hypothetical protein CDL15_Pgr028856 [Punica granatum]PKI47381.1 hypothetical protein CRG98_032216 [Punica granatum]